MAPRLPALFALALVSGVYSLSITDIQGPAWSSPYLGQTVRNVTGTVVAKGEDGFFLVGPKSDDIRRSNGIYVFSSSAARNVAVGDAISLNGRVEEYRPSGSPNNLLLTEITSPTNIVKLSTRNPTVPIVLGVDRSPPTTEFTALDLGSDGFLSVPNNQTRIQTVNATLQPDKFGLDFWESLEGQLVTIPSPVALGFPNSFGDIWVHGDWAVTGKNKRGGLTLTSGPSGVPDGNPEAIFVGDPLDGKSNPATTMGSRLSNITGVVTSQFGFYYVLPLTAPTVIAPPEGVVEPTTLVAQRTPAEACTITIGDYNVENLTPRSSHLRTIAKHIVDYLRTPDILFLQEIQDNSGATNDKTVSANITLTTLVNAIRDLSNVTYSFVTVDPVDGQDGGEPGGNIRNAYMYKADALSLVSGSPAGGPLDAVRVDDSPLKLSVNPGRIDPSSSVWQATRKPLVAHWQTRFGNQLFTVNVHLSSKGGSSSTQGDARPPVNSPIQNRRGQVASVAGFVADVLSKNPEANIVVAGDFNEFLQARSVYEPITRYLTDIDEAAGVPEVERYGYVFDQNSQKLDHVLLSSALTNRTVEFEHIHVNTWAARFSDRISDHDPSVGRIRLC